LRKRRRKSIPADYYPRLRMR